MTTFNAGAIEANLTLGRSSWTRDLRKTKQEIADLERRSVTIDVDLHTENAEVAMNNLELFLDDLENNTYTPSVDLIINEAEEALQRLEERLDALDRRTVVVAADADIDNAMIQLDNLENQMDVLENDPVNIGADADTSAAEAKLLELSLQMQRMSLSEVDIDVDMDGYSSAVARMNILDSQIAMLNGREIDIDVDMDRAMLRNLVGAAGGSGGGYLGLLRILIYSIIVLSPVLAVAMSSATAALIGFAAAAAGALGAVAVLAGGLVGLIARFNELDPSERTAAMWEFADALELVKSAWDGFLDSIGDAGFSLMADALGLVAMILPTLAPLFNQTAEAVGGVLDGIRDFVESPEYREMLDFFGGFGVDMLVSFMNIGGNLIQFFGRLFQAIEPFAREMMRGLEDVTAGWAQWADDLENNDAFQTFMDNALEYGPMVLDMLGSLLQAFIAIGDALLPFAGPMLEGLTWLFDLIANAPVEILTALIAAFAGLWLGLNVLAPILSTVVTVLSALGTALSLPLGAVVLIVGAIIGLIAVMVHLWRTNEEFRAAVIDAWNRIVETVKPIIKDIEEFVRDNWGPLQEWIKDIWHDVKEIVVNAMIVIRQIVRGVTTVVSALWRQFGDDIMRQAKTAFTMVGNIIKGAFQIIKGLFQVLRGALTGDTRQMWEGLTNIWRGAVQIVSGIVRGLYETVRNQVQAIRGVMDSLIGFFRGLGGRVSSAVSGMWDGITAEFRSVINTIIGWWNGLAFTLDIPNAIPGLPGSFTITSPDVGYLAQGGYITDPGLFVVGEGGEPEIVSPESKMREIVRENSGGGINYEQLATAVAVAIGQVLSRMGAVTRADIEDLMRAAGVDININGEVGDSKVKQLASDVVYKLRVLGYGGVYSLD